MRHRAHDREVVADEDIAHAVVALQLGQQREHLLLDRDVERRGRLVEHQHLRPQHHRAGDRDALALAAARTRADSAAARRPRPARSLSPTSSSICDASARRARPSSRSARCSASPSPTIWPTVMRGLSDANGSWNTTCMRLRIARSVARVGVVDALRRRTRSSPPRSAASASSAMPSVVLPEPDSPTMPSVSPRRSCSVGVPHRGELALARTSRARSRTSRRHLRPRAGSAHRPPAAAPRAAAGWPAASACRHAADRANTVRGRRRSRPACRAPSRRRDG